MRHFATNESTQYKPASTDASAYETDCQKLDCDHTNTVPTTAAKNKTSLFLLCHKQRITCLGSVVCLMSFGSIWLGEAFAIGFSIVAFALIAVWLLTKHAEA